MNFLKGFLCVFLAVIFQSQWMMLGSFDLLALFSFYFVLRYNWIAGSLFGFLSGLIWDSLSGTPLGLKSLSILGASCLVQLMHSLIYQSHMVTRFGIVGVGTFICLSLEWITYGIMGGFKPTTLSSIFWAALWNGILAVLIYPILNHIFRESYDQLIAS